MSLWTDSWLRRWLVGMATDERKFKLAARAGMVFAGSALLQPQTVALFDLPDVARQLGPFLMAVAAMLPSGKSTNGGGA